MVGVLGVGTRLLVAGIVQLVRPETTAAILGSEKPAASELRAARELSTANIGMGLAGLLALNPPRAAAAGTAGGVFLLIAGLMHIAKRNTNAQETLVTWDRPHRRRRRRDLDRLHLRPVRPLLLTHDQPAGRRTLWPPGPVIRVRLRERLGG